MKQLIDFIEQLTGSHDWIVLVFVVVFGMLLLNYFVHKLYGRLEKRVTKTHNLWDDALLWAVTRPSHYFILALGTRLVCKIMEPVLDEAINGIVQPLYTVAFIAIVIWSLIRLITKLEETLKTPGRTKEPIDPTTVTAMARLLRLSVLITGGLVMAQSLGISISGVLAFGGIGGIAVGFAAKDLLANFFGGLMLYLDRPFSVGDWIRSPDRDIEGTVENIGWRLTVIRTFDKRPLYVPNSMFNSIAVENPSRMTNRRIYETMGLRYDDVAKLPAIIADVKQMLIDHPEIDSGKTMIVNFNSYAASSLDFFVYTFTVTTKWIKFHEIKQDVLLRIADIVAGHGAEFAFPTRTLHMLQEPAAAGETAQSE